MIQHVLLVSSLLCSGSQTVSWIYNTAHYIVFLCNLDASKMRPAWCVFPWVEIHLPVTYCERKAPRLQAETGRDFCLESYAPGEQRNTFDHFIDIQFMHTALANRALSQTDRTMTWHLKQFMNKHFHKLKCLPDTWRHLHSDILWTPAEGFWAWSSRDCCHGDSGISARMYGLWPETEKKGLRSLEKRLRLPMNPFVE